VLAFIDADIEFYDGEDFLRLLKMEGPIRGIAVSMKTPDGTEALSAWKDGKMLKRDLMVGTHTSVDYIGSAVLMVERTHFKTLWSRYTNLQFDDPVIGPCCALFECMISRGTYLSEDYGFCCIAQKAGIEIIAENRAIVGHHGNSEWRF
jgi:hypothetical protein